MFSPSYQITNKILSSLINIEVNSKIIELAQLQVDWEGRLRLESLVKRIYSVFHFVENGLSTDDVAKIVKDEPERDDKAGEVALRTGVVGKEKDVQQVLNFLNANKLSEQISYLTNKFKQTDYGVNDLIKLNTLVGERLVAVPELGGYRQSDGVYENREGIPLAVEVPFQMEDLFGWFNSVTKNELHPVLKAGTMLYELVRIGPFVNNNLITALCFNHLILSSEGYHHKQIWAPEEEILKNREIYTLAVASVERDGGSLTIWLEHFTRWMEEASEKTKIKVLNLVGETPIFKSEKGRVVSLTEREIVIMEEMTIKNEMTIKEIRSVLLMVSDDTILRDLKDLMDKKLIKKKGKTKGALYVMGKMRSYR
ncbi:MAG: hypothetical protein UX08_C0028G0001 [Candidatus Collierbacteria bacterium GW2011_GWB1_45_35]|uniref:Fido domain-containing protein n=1 Tax=Candidatus Collierbacteria bacterium GW2011_GWB2_45_17 TaxID=1618388 RepID=A0A837IIP0_9BACT|nr:MAG: hypothetical protein UW48_C0002G0022 [Microgenomates group bacterium GW2011_GWC1_44_23]KKT95586.1 MAG: hypothetical protein UW96_C0006G0017 [Candidatus Collierbacteria bacterium GW2011_GWA1_45_15]KKU00514.1 MAG: hypothetical protein UX01_C0004G0081 [Candidatus Collierbacteria bacterium GW2011_GWB2_45_17]KKU04379.1 MAG: hypothetical protein UX08_C0028G0001 [Candidatus Collierbacteria bacterium GW2011_GWB1_45_35]KKU08227.1 MAG: hypothetical protein UX11_C0006G0083 [Candidatus Collierbacte